MEIYIPHNVPSSKNTLKPIAKGVLINGDSTKAYKSKTFEHWANQRAKFKEAIKLCPLKNPSLVHLSFIRDSKRKFDLHNACQIIADIMTQFHWIEDDNADEMVIVFDPDYKVDKTKPGVIIKLLSEKPKYIFYGLSNGVPET